VLALLPGFPVLPFAALAAASGAAALAADRRRASGPAAVTAAGGVERAALGPGAPLTLELAGDLAALARGRGDRFEQEWLPALCAELTAELGFPLGGIAVRPGRLGPGGWRLLLDGVPAASGAAPASQALALIPPAELETMGIQAQSDPDPVTGRPASRIAAEDAGRAAALAPVRGPLERVSAGIAAALRGHAHHLFGVQDVQALLGALEASHPALVAEASRQLGAPLLAEVLRRLLEEGIPVRPLHVILEGLLEAGGPGRGADALAEVGRRALRRHIAFRHASTGVLEALLLGRDAESVVREADRAGAQSGPGLPALLDAIGAQLALRAGEPPVLLTTPELRRAVRKLVAPRFPRIAVLSYEELPGSLLVRPVGKVALQSPGSAERTGG
jgi:type III secretion protein V